MKLTKVRKVNVARRILDSEAFTEMIEPTVFLFFRMFMYALVFMHVLTAT